MSSTPEAPLQFDCPACGAVLTVPAAIAGMQGPCPKCWQEIVSPDPAHGLSARLPAPPPVVAAEPVPAPPPAVEQEPAPVPALAPEVAAEAEEEEEAGAAPVRRSKARLALAIGVPALMFAAIGYHFGKGHRPMLLESSLLSPPATPTPAAEPAPSPAAEATSEGLQPPPPPESSAANDAQDALVAFLGAPDWLARSAFVLSAEEIRPAMEEHAKVHGDGPIPASAIQLLEVSPPNHIFKVCTKAIPDGFPVPVTLTGEGPKIDWEAFIAFNDDHFKKLLEGPADQSGIFDLLVKPEAGDEPSPHYARYRLAVPMPGREATAWIRKDSVALARLKAVFDGAGGYDKDIVDKLVSETGVPLRLAVAKRRTNDSREYIEVVDLVAVGWAPAKP